MKKLMIIAMGLVWCGFAFADPSPTPVPSPSPVPNVIPDWAADEIPVSMDLDFTEQTSGAITDMKFINMRTGESFTVPANYRFYVTDISWSLQSEVIATLEFDGVYADVRFDKMYGPFTGQGKINNLVTPITSLDPGISPVLTTDRPCTGWVYVGGYLK